MIKINKTMPAPQILVDSSIGEKKKLIADYTADPGLYTSGVGKKKKDIKSFEFYNSIYGSEEVKKQLITDQFEKCCFCEAKFSDNSYGDVEHYRPKTAYKNEISKSLNYPGYYWLAYEWSNLMFSCEKCNRTYKRNHFPLSDESTRKLSHNHVNLLENEDTLLINPIIEDPADFITFNDEVPVPVNSSKKGKKTIKILKLERMNDSRLEHLQMLEANIALTRIDKTIESDLDLAVQLLKIPKKKVIELIQIAESVCNNAAKSNAKFSASVRCKFPDLPTH